MAGKEGYSASQQWTVESAQLDTLQQRWDTAIVSENKRQGAMDNYNPVLARWNWERAQTTEQREIYRATELNNITTALRERHHTQESRLRFSIDADNKIRNDTFPEEPYETVLERGRAYRKEHGTQDGAREAAEVEGFKSIQATLTNPETPKGTTFVTISPPSLIANSPYQKNFVDIYQVMRDPDSGERTIDYVRYASPLSYEQYAQVARKIRPEYLDVKKESEEILGEPISLDAWYLGNPLLLHETSHSPDDIFNKYFAEDVKAMEEAEWQKIDQIYLPYKLYLLDQLTKNDFDPEAIAQAYTAMLVSTEEKYRNEQPSEVVVFDRSDTRLHEEAYHVVGNFVKQHGQDHVEAVQAGCGNSSGFTTRDGGGQKSFFMSNSVAQFYEGRYFVCTCGWRATEEIGNRPCGGCGMTKEVYKELHGVVCD